MGKLKNHPEITLFSIASWPFVISIRAELTIFDNGSFFFGSFMIIFYVLSVSRVCTALEFYIIPMKKPVLSQAPLLHPAYSIFFIKILIGYEDSESI